MVLKSNLKNYLMYKCNAFVIPSVGFHVFSFLMFWNLEITVLLRSSGRFSMKLIHSNIPMPMMTPKVLWHQNETYQTYETWYLPVIFPVILKYKSTFKMLSCEKLTVTAFFSIIINYLCFLSKKRLNAKQWLEFCWVTLSVLSSLHYRK